jgi:hypothetical protein
MHFMAPGASSGQTPIEAQVLGGLTPREDATLRRLERTDQIVRSRGGAYDTADAGMTPAPRHVLVSGPDGRQYAVDGEMQTDVCHLASVEARAHGRDPVRRSDLSQAVVLIQDEAAVASPASVPAELAPEREGSLGQNAHMAEAMRAAEREGDALSVNGTEGAARFEPMAALETADDLPLGRSAGSPAPVVEGVEVPEARVADPEPESPNDTVPISSGFIEFLRNSQPDLVLGASVPLDGGADALAGSQTPAQRAYSAAENVYQGRGDFVALA